MPRIRIVVADSASKSNALFDSLRSAKCPSVMHVDGSVSDLGLFGPNRSMFKLAKGCPLVITDAEGLMDYPLHGLRKHRGPSDVVLLTRTDDAAESLRSRMRSTRRR